MFHALDLSAASHIPPNQHRSWIGQHLIAPHRGCAAHLLRLAYWHPRLGNVHRQPSIQQAKAVPTTCVVTTTIDHPGKQVEEFASRMHDGWEKVMPPVTERPNGKVHPPVSVQNINLTSRHGQDVLDIPPGQ